MWRRKVERSKTSKQAEMIDLETAFLVAAAMWEETGSTEDASDAHLYAAPVVFHAMRPFLRGMLSIQPAGVVRPFSPPRYPLKTTHDVHYCDMAHWGRRCVGWNERI